MKLFKEDSMYLSKRQWTKLFVAFSISYGSAIIPIN